MSRTFSAIGLPISFTTSSNEMFLVPGLGLGGRGENGFGQLLRLLQLW